MKTADDYRARCGTPARRAPPLRPAHRQHARRPGARLHRAARAVLDGRDVSIAAVAELAIRSSPPSMRHTGRCRPAFRGGAGNAARGGARGDPRARRTRVRHAADVLPHRIRAEGPHHARGRSDAGRQGLLRPARSANTPRWTSAPSRSTRSAWRKSPRIRAEMQEVIEQTRLQGDVRRVPHLPSHRSAVPTPRRRSNCSTAPGFPSAWTARSASSSARCRAGASPSSRCWPTSRRSGRPAAADWARTG